MTVVVLGSSGLPTGNSAEEIVARRRAALGQSTNIADNPVSGTDNKDTNENGPKQSIDYEANILDDYDSVTYHFRLFMMSADGIKDMKFDPTGQAKRVLIAESGANTIGIDDVSITTFPTPSKRHRFGSATNIRFTLMQPFGADLVDKIYAASKRLGLKQFAKVPFFLELSFRGREPDRTLGGSKFPGAFQEALLGEDALSDVVWVWPIKLKNMNMTVDSGGSMYTIQAVANNNIAFSNQVSDIKKDISLTSSTVRDAFTELEEKLTNQEEIKEGETQSQAKKDTYRFFIDSEFADSKIIPDSSEELGPSGEFDKEAPERSDFSYQQGTSIEKIAENIMSASVRLQLDARGTKNEDAAASKGQKEKATEQKLYRIYGQCYLGEFDEVRNDYARHYMYAIVPYVTTGIVSRTNRDAGVSSQQRYDALRLKNRLRKSYNYIYTGLNDQVFDFDVSLNFSWYAIERFLAGRDINARFEPKGKTSEDQQESEQKEADPQSWVERLGVDPDSGLGEFVDDVEDFVETEGFDGAVEGIFTGDFDQLTGASSRFLADQISSATRLGLGKLNPYLTQDRLQEREQLIEEQEADERAANAWQNSATFIESAVNEQHDVSGGDVKNPGKILLAQIFDQATEQVSKDLVSISIRLKGDPFWLSPGAIGRGERFRTEFEEALENYGVGINPYDPNGGVETLDATANTAVTSAEFALQSQYFLFRLLTPLEPEADTGIVTGLGKNNTISGVYIARVIEHSFSGGQFTQTIDAARDIYISLDNVDLGIAVADDRGALEQLFNQGIRTETIIDNVDSVKNPSRGTTEGTIYEVPGGADVDNDFLENLGNPLGNNIGRG